MFDYVNKQKNYKADRRSAAKLSLNQSRGAPTRTDFTTSCICAGTRPDGHPYAYIDWEHAITALDTRQLSCSPSEAGILRIAASLGDHHIPVHLARVLGSLDHASIARVTTAITRANG